MKRMNEWMDDEKKVRENFLLILYFFFRDVKSFSTSHLSPLTLHNFHFFPPSFATSMFIFRFFILFYILSTNSVFVYLFFFVVLVQGTEVFKEIWWLGSDAELWIIWFGEKCNWAGDFYGKLMTYYWSKLCSFNEEFFSDFK